MDTGLCPNKQLVRKQLWDAFVHVLSKLSTFIHCRVYVISFFVRGIFFLAWFFWLVLLVWVKVVCWIWILMIIFKWTLPENVSTWAKCLSSTHTFTLQHRGCTQEVQYLLFESALPKMCEIRANSAFSHTFLGSTSIPRLTAIRAVFPRSKHSKAEAESGMSSPWSWGATFLQSSWYFTSSNPLQAVLMGQNAQFWGGTPGCNSALLVLLWKSSALWMREETSAAGLLLISDVFLTILEQSVLCWVRFFVWDDFSSWLFLLVREKKWA